MRPHRFLIEGLDHDDAWIMVEDEFYAVAQSYTQHLHYAEYVRRKKEAKAQNATAIGEIKRPTDGRTAMPKNLQLKKEAEALAARQKEGLEQFAGQGDDDNDDDNDDDDDDDEAWAGTHLHGLMTSPRKVRSLPGVHAIRSTTRAAAGFGQASGSNGTSSQVLGSTLSAPLSSGTGAQRNEIDELTASSEDDDLEGPTQAVTTPSARQVERKGPASSSRVVRHFTQRENGSNRVSTVEKREPSAQASDKPREFKSRVQMLFDDLDELPEPSRSNRFISDKQKEPSNAHKTPEPGTGDADLKPKQSRYKDVPTFVM